MNFATNHRSPMYLMKLKTLCSIAAFATMITVCGCNKADRQAAEPGENLKAKTELAGIWIDADEETAVFKIKGDTIYYPDSTSRPVEFKIIEDTMVLHGNSISKYPIVRRSAHIFEFKNQNNETVKLVKSEDPNDTLQFTRQHRVPLNQGKIIKSDTVVVFSGKKYHSYVQINPTTYKVYRSFYNAEGIEIENIYYDNIIHVSVFSGRDKVFSKDFTKSDFSSAVPHNMLKQSVLSDIKLTSLSADGLHYQTQLAIPDSPSRFLVELTISYSGKISVKVQK